MSVHSTSAYAWETLRHVLAVGARDIHLGVATASRTVRLLVFVTCGFWSFMLSCYQVLQGARR